MQRSLLSSPIGAIEVIAIDGGAMISVSFVDESGLDPGQGDDACPRAVRQLAEYFRGERRRFDLDLEPEGTDFERSVWKEVLGVPYGSTATYGEIAQRLGEAEAARAVGVANARNPIAIIIPCHRVVGADGDLTGYAGGLERKKWLLAHESGQRQLDF